MANPYGMDEACTRCPELSETRSTIVHGYGDVTADFLFVAAMPTAAADEQGHPVVGAEGAYSLTDLLDAIGFRTGDVDAAGQPVLDNAFVTHLTRCHHPDRSPTDREIEECEPFLNAELRTINPDILLPLSERVLHALAADYTTKSPTALAIDEVHATEVRGRGFELIPLRDPRSMNDTEFEAAVDVLTATIERDYRQTKGRRSR